MFRLATIHLLATELFQLAAETFQLAKMATGLFQLATAYIGIYRRLTRLK
jgi:hypothetical protein